MAEDYSSSNLYHYKQNQILILLARLVAIQAIYAALLITVRLLEIDDLNTNAHHQ